MADSSHQSPWRDPSNIIATIAALLALSSLAVSIRSCIVSDRTLEIARLEWASQRTMLLGATVTTDGTALELHSLDPSMILQQGKAIFPAEVDDQEWPILPPDHRLYVVMLRAGLQRVLEEKVGREPGKASVSIDANVPVVISSLFSAKGQLYEDTSLYRIVFSFVIDGDSSAPPTVDFKGLIHLEHMESDRELRKGLDQFWSATQWPNREQP